MKTQTCNIVLKHFSSLMQILKTTIIFSRKRTCLFNDFCQFCFKSTSKRFGCFHRYLDPHHYNNQQNLEFKAFFLVQVFSLKKELDFFMIAFDFWFSDPEGQNNLDPDPRCTFYKWSQMLDIVIMNKSDARRKFLIRFGSTLIINSDLDQNYEF